MVSRPVGMRSQREQINLVLQADSPLARRLRDAETETGQSRTQIVREIVDAFLDTWKRAELAKHQLLAAPSNVTSPAVLPRARLTPRVRHGYLPAPGLSEAVAARQPVPDRVAGSPMEVAVSGRVRLKPRSRLGTTRDTEADET